MKALVPMWCSGECTEIKCANWSALHLLFLLQVSVILPDTLSFLPESIYLHVLYKIMSNKHSSTSMC